MVLSSPGMNLPAAETAGYLRNFLNTSVIPAKAGIQGFPEETGFPLEFIPHSDAGRE
jgi:hypothetical protein